MYGQCQLQQAVLKPFLHNHTEGLSAMSYKSNRGRSRLYQRISSIWETTRSQSQDRSISEMTMAQVPDMESYLMDNNSEYEGDFYGVISHGSKKGVHNSHCISCHRRSCVCSSGIHLEMATEVDSGYSFRKTVVLVVAVEKLKKGLICNMGFKNTDLLNLLNYICVQEEIPFENTEFTSASFPKYKCIKTSQYSIRDSHNKCMALQQFPGNAKLVAVLLQGLNTQREGIEGHV
ncbi:interleukin-1 beta-like [Pelobates fuscus]|uniref:interleukin-1 beta-like n=1 Tax=Pelobates fuscus TaxID=191477 RepID=UPI002FE4611A